MKLKNVKVILTSEDELQTLIIDSVNACLEHRNMTFSEWELKKLKEWYSNNIDKLIEWHVNNRQEMDETPNVFIRLFEGDIS